MSEEFDFWCKFIWFDSDFQIQHGSWRSSWKLAHSVVGFSDYCGVWVRKRHSCYPFHDDVIKWKPFPRYCPFVRGIHRSPVNSPHKGQWRGALMFSLIWAWIIGWVNNREAGDLRRYQAHHDVIVIWWLYLVLAFTLVILKTAIPIQKFIFCVYGYMYMHRKVSKWINMTWFAQSECYAYRASNKYTTGNSDQLFIN